MKNQILFFILFLFFSFSCLGSDGENLNINNDSENDTIQQDGVDTEIELPSVISDNMVLQQNSKVRLWGKASVGSKIKIIPEWSKSPSFSFVDENGNWELILETSSAGGPYSIEISNGKKMKRLKNILLGEVWICAGQSNMSMPLRGWGAQVVANSAKTIQEADNYNEIRIFTAKQTISDKKEFDVEGKWVVASSQTAGDLTAVGYHYAKRLKDKLEVPVGMISLSWGGSNVQAWMSYDNLKMFPEASLSIDLNSKTPQRIPTALYNAMFNPVSNFTIQGVIWYQGESNIREEDLYVNLFPAMVKEWRKEMGREDIPFYYVQIAPSTYDGDKKTTSAYIREAQEICMRLIPYSGMIVTMDVGAKNNIHPPNKEIIAQRLSSWAFANTYKLNGIQYLSPFFKGYEITGDKIVVSFENAEEGLIQKTELDENGFEISGKEHVFFPARIELKNDKIEVFSPHVKEPINLRYCFKNYIEGSVFNTNGLPLAPFRTDTLKE